MGEKKEETALGVGRSLEMWQGASGSFPNLLLLKKDCTDRAQITGSSQSQVEASNRGLTLRTVTVQECLRSSSSEFKRTRNRNVMRRIAVLENEADGMHEHVHDWRRSSLSKKPLKNKKEKSQR